MSKEPSYRQGMIDEINAISKKRHVSSVALSLYGQSWTASTMALARTVDPTKPATVGNEVGIPYGDLTDHELSLARDAFRDAERNPEKTMTPEEAALDEDLWHTLEAKWAGNPEALKSLRKNRELMSRGLPPRLGREPGEDE